MYLIERRGFYKKKIFYTQNKQPSPAKIFFSQSSTNTISNKNMNKLFFLTKYVFFF